MTELLAPNGKPSNLTPEQYKLVRTPAFKEWFGDWEKLVLTKINDSGIDEISLKRLEDRVSKVVDFNGEPLVVFHGTNAQFWKFDKSKGKGNIKQKSINFSSDKKVAENYGTKIIQCFLNLKKPLIKDYKGENYHTINFNARFESRIDDIPDYIVNNAQSEKNYDGVIFLNIQDSKSAYDKFSVPIANNYYAFNNKQIKLADGTNTTFDSNNPDIRFETGGEIIYLKGKKTKLWKILQNHYLTKEEAEIDNKNYSQLNIFKEGELSEMINVKAFDEENYYDFDMFEKQIAKILQNKLVDKIELEYGDYEGERTHWLTLYEVKNPDIRFEEGGLIAPNGKPSGLYFTEIYNLVRTKEFKEWFGDWEEAYKTKDYEGVSKIIDENGEPLICVHNTPNEFYEFDEFEIGRTTDAGYYGKGFYFTPNVGQSRYGEIELNCFLNIKNPHYKQASYRNYELNSDELKSQGYDGVVVYPNWIENFNFENGVDGCEEVVAYYSEQIKLGDGTNTTFDGSNADIRFEDGGEARPFTDDGNKLVVYKTKDYKIAVDNIDKARYITLWFVNSLFDLDVKVGYLALYETEDGFLKVQEIDIQKQHRGKGLSTIMYLMALKYSSDNIKGIKSYLPDRVNKKQVPKIYKKLNAKNVDDWAYIYKSDNVKNFKKGGDVIINPTEIECHKCHWKWEVKDGGDDLFICHKCNYDNTKFYKFEGLKGKKILDTMLYKTGGRTISQTPAPKKDQIKGSDKNKEGSAKDISSAKKIKFSDDVLEKIQNSVDKHNKKHPNKKITLDSAKAVVRRGMGAYSSTHRPTISGGNENSRVAWGLARLNAFFYKIVNGKSKSGKYSQDNDLIEELGYKVQKYADGGEFENEEFENSALFFGGFFTGIQRQGIGKSIIYDIFKNNPKLENILLYTQQDAIGFWQKLGGEVIKQGKDKNGVHRYYVKINRNSITKSKNIKELRVSYENIDTNKAEISKGEYSIKYGRQKIGFFFVDDLGTIKTDPKKIILFSNNKEKYADGVDIQAYKDAMGISEFKEGGETKPKKVYVSIPLKSKYENILNENGFWDGTYFINYEEKTFEDLQSGKLVGVIGVSSSPHNVGEWFYHRNCLIVMKYDEFVKLNDFTIIDYDNPEQLMADDMKLLNRLYQNKRDENTDEETLKEQRRNILHKVLGKFKQPFDIANKKEPNLSTKQGLYRIEHFLEESYKFINWIVNNNNILNSSDDLAEKIIEYHYSDDSNYISTFYGNTEDKNIDKKYILPFVIEMIKSAGNVYKSEQEIYLNNKTLNIPIDSQLFFKNEKDQKSNLSELIDKYKLREKYSVYFVKHQDIVKYSSLASQQRNTKEQEKFNYDRKELEIKKDAVVHELLYFFLGKSLKSFKEIIEKEIAEYSDSTLFYYDYDEERKEIDWYGIILVQAIINKYIEIIQNNWKQFISSKDVKDITIHSFFDFQNNSNRELNKYFEDNKSELEKINDYHNINGNWLSEYRIEYWLKKSVDDYQDMPEWIDYKELAKMYLEKMDAQMYRYYSEQEIPLFSKYKNGGSILLAPNGKPSNLTPEQYKLVRTPEFKAWFGDWENSPENASKVVDKNGEPLVVYHGSKGFYDGKNKQLEDKDITQFSSERLIFTTDNIDIAKYFGDFKQYFVNIKKPFIIDDGYNVWERLDEDYLIKKIGKQKFIEIINQEYGESFTYDEWLKYVNEVEALPISIDVVSVYIKKNKYYDGVIAFDIQETTNHIESNDFICFNPNEIKLADGTNTEFDGNNPDIRYSDGGLIAPNGIESNLSPEQYKLVRTPAFKKWFGNWEKKQFLNKHKPNSTIYLFNTISLDENGEPRIWFRATHNEYNIIESEYVYLGAKKSYVKQYGKPKEFFVKANKTIFIDNEDIERKKLGITFDYLAEYISDENEISRAGENYEKLKDKFKNQKDVLSVWEYFTFVGNEEIIELFKGWFSEYGFDSIMYWETGLKNNFEKYPVGLISLYFGDEYLKLADGTNITFDENNPDIRFDEGGKIEELNLIENNTMNTNNPKDTITMDIPLLIRFSELMREDIKTDVALHEIVENLLEIKDKGVLTMHDYDSIVGNVTGLEENENEEQKMKMGGVTKGQQDKISKVLHEFKQGTLKTSYGEKVTDRQQAIAIALSEAEINKKEEGGKVESIHSEKGDIKVSLDDDWYSDDTKVELVPVSELIKFREYDRKVSPKYNQDNSRDNINHLKFMFQREGVKSPLIIEYSAEDNAVLIIEGNHRLNSAIDLGMEYLPARVVLKKYGKYSPAKIKNAMQVNGIKANSSNYIPSDLKPSQIGITGAKPIAYAEGGIIEGRLHSECGDDGCGRKFQVGENGHIIEAERDEAVIVAEAFNETKEMTIEGTPSEIASALNVIGGGKNFNDGAKIIDGTTQKEVSEIETQATDTDVDDIIDSGSIIINRRSMADEKSYKVTGSAKQIASAINSINGNGVVIEKGAKIE